MVNFLTVVDDDVTDVSADEEDGALVLMCVADFEDCCSRLENKTPINKVLDSTSLLASGYERF